MPAGPRRGRFVGNAYAEGAVRLDAGALKEHLGNYRVVDVREQDEWDAGHLPGSVHVPLAQLPDQVGSIDASKPVVLVCRTGVRSRKATELLAGKGIEAENLDGGLVACDSEGLRLVDAQGRPGRVIEFQAEPDDLAPELAGTRDNFLEVIFGLQERYGNREPTDEEATEFMRDWLQGKGKSPEEIERILAQE